MSDVKAGFKITSTWIDKTLPDFPNADGWTVRVTNPRGKTLQRQYFKGSGHNGAKPELEEFLSCLISDAECVEYRSEAEFAEDLGYDYETTAEIANVRKIYNACTRIAEKLETFLTPEEFDAFRDQ